jgi:murein DD-endopeptidase MepM/ murein hydrolase activator NlpD
MKAPRAFLGRFLTTLILGTPLVCIMGTMLTIGLLGVAHDTIPDEYNAKMAELLGLGCFMNYSVSAEDAKIFGGQSSAIANAQAAANWCRGRFNTPIDVGIMLAIFQRETGGGANFGNCSGMQAARDYGHNQPYYAQALLSYWRNHHTRSVSSSAASFIRSDYSDYIGHCSAGEVGSGFIPRTAYIVCTEGLSGSGDADLNSCNFWSTKTTFFAIAYWLYRIGYRSDLSYETKLSKLSGWNHNVEYRRELLALASSYNGGSVGVNGSIFPTGEQYGESFLGTLRLEIIQILDDIGLLPEVNGWLEAPLHPEDIRGISQDWMETRFGDPHGHPGIDFACVPNAPVIAVAAGVVITPSPGSMGSWPAWGNVVWIYHGNSIYTVSAHLAEVYVTGGQEVKQGEVIGTCGSTGNSTGPHVHFGVASKHPDDFSSYRDRDPGWENPHLYLGTCGVDVNQD